MSLNMENNTVEISISIQFLHAFNPNGSKNGRALSYYHGSAFILSRASFSSIARKPTRGYIGRDLWNTHAWQVNKSFRLPSAANYSLNLAFVSASRVQPELRMPTIWFPVVSQSYWRLNRFKRFYYRDSMGWFKFIFIRRINRKREVRVLQYLWLPRMTLSKRRTRGRYRVKRRHISGQGTFGIDDVLKLDLVFRQFGTTCYQNSAIHCFSACPLR
jgi:hypothetical protein